MSKQIDPLAVEWIPLKATAGAARYRRYKRGRPTPIAARLPWLSGIEKKVLLKATPDSARAALANLEKHAHPAKIAHALLAQLLQQAAEKPRAYRRRASHAGGIAISATAEAALALLDDLKWYAAASRSSAKPILQSVAATFLRLAIEAATSRRQYLRECIAEAVRLYGSWIHAFALRVTDQRTPRRKDDSKLLARLIKAARTVGYAPKLFYSTRPNCQPRLLRWPLQAFILELCVGVRKKGGWWVESGLSSPMETVQRELRRRRRLGSDEGKPGRLYKLIVGKDEWSRIVSRSIQADTPPRAIVRALRHLTRLKLGRFRAPLYVGPICHRLLAMFIERHCAQERQTWKQRFCDCLLLRKALAFNVARFTSACLRASGPPK